MTPDLGTLSDALIPVSASVNGFTPEEATDRMARFSFREMFKAEEVSVFVFLNFGQAYPLTCVARSAPAVPLEQAWNPAIGETRMSVPVGDLSLNEYLVHPESRAQGMIVVRRGKIAFEAYPGMRDFDDHVWMSISKTTVSLLVRMLADEGKVDVDAPIDSYVARLRDTEWSGTRVQDLLDMASGMDIVENQDTRLDPNSTISRFNNAGLGVPDASGVVERQLDVIASAKRLRPPGEAFEYSSCNTILLVLMTEALTNRRWHELLRERVWSKMTVEGDMLVGVSPDGIAQAYGYLNARLRDVARYGMLYTPSWPSAARQQIVPDGYVRQIQTAGRKGDISRGRVRPPRNLRGLSQGSTKLQHVAMGRHLARW
ncbi:MAG TPA: serine hydrolase domain-containing protein [Solirubrobacteraceae bacterium]|nr:serine hydrolase domain-containing protein [Solirubrobacteraceae bacterium]